MRIRKALVGLCAALPLALTSCFELRTVNPLSDPQQAKVDENLIGRWEYKVNHNWYLVEIDRHPLAGKRSVPAGLMVVKTTDLAEKSETTETLIFVTVIGKETFYNHGYTLGPPKAGKADEPAEEPWKYSFGKYAVQRDKLHVYFPLEQRHVIEKGLLKGEVRYYKGFGGLANDRSYLTDTTENLQKFMANGGSKHLFSDDKVVLTRK